MKKIKILYYPFLFLILSFWFVNPLCSQKKDSVFQTNLYPGSKGWIKKYLNLVNNSKIHLQTIDKKQFILPFSRPDSLIFANQISDSNWTTFEKEKLWFFECMLDRFLIKNKDQNLNQFVHSLAEFYEIQKDSLHETKQLEKKINKRLRNDNQYGKHFWYRYEMNPFMYIDVLLFEEFLNSGLTISEFPMLELKLVLVNMANERSLLDGTVSENEKKFLALLNCNLNHQELSDTLFSFDYANELLKTKYATQLLKGFNYEILALDGFSPVEKNWFQDNYGKIELNNKADETEVFHKSNFKAFAYLFRSNWKIIKKRNKQKLANEYVETKEWGKLLIKKGKLTNEEKQFRNSQSKDLLMVVPSAVIFLIPGGSVILPFVVKFVPAFIPTSFRDNSIE